MLAVVGLLMAFFSVPFWIVGFFLVRLTVRGSFTHENLTITPRNFRIKRTVELRRRHRDSVNNAAIADAPLTRMDRIFCKQLEGATGDLTTATVRVDFDSGDSILTLVSVSVDKRSHGQKRTHMEVLCTFGRLGRTQTLPFSFR